MNLSRLFIVRPIMTTLVMVGILLAGIMGYLQLPVSDLPNVDFPTITVSASLPGANPETMAASVATPLEQQFATIAGIDSMNSTSSLGNTSVTLQFNLSRDLDAAAQDVQSAISTATRRLPPNMPSPPSLRKVNPADMPIIYITLSSELIPLSRLDDYAQKLVAQRLSMITGVAQVNVYGSQKYAVRVQLNPLELFARNIGLNDITAAIQANNTNLPVGVLYGNQQNVTLKSSGQLTSATDYKTLVVAYRNGAPIQLQSVATVKDDVENPRQATWLYTGDHKTRGIILAIQRQPGSNTLQVTRDIKEALPSLQAFLPPSVKMGMLYDRSVPIRRSVDDVQFTLLLTIGLVVAVIFVFLRNLSATVIATVALPMALVGTFAVMALLGFNLDNISLMALTLSVGFVVDDAIVVMENIIRHMEMGKNPMQAALEGSAEIGFTVLSMTLSLVAVFLPVLLMQGLIGRLFNEFAVTIAVAILISGVISLTLTPMMCSRFLKSSRHQDDANIDNAVGDGLRAIPMAGDGMARGPSPTNNATIQLKTRWWNPLDWFERLIQQVYSLYADTLRWTLNHKGLTLASFFAMIGLTVWTFTLVPKGFIPNEDLDQLFIPTEGRQGISFTQMVALQSQLAELAAATPGVETVMSAVDPTNQGRLFLRLKPVGNGPDQRKTKVEELSRELGAKMRQVPGIRAFVQAPAAIRLGPNTRSPYQITLQSPNTAELYPAAQALEARLRTVPGLTDVNSDMQLNNPQALIQIDRQKAGVLGVTASQIEQALSAAYGTQQITLFYTPTDTYQVILELDPQYQLTPETLALMYVRSSNGNLVPLSTLASIQRNVGPLSVSHLGQFPSVTISYNTAPGQSLGAAVEQINTIAAQMLPESVKASAQGTAQAFQSSLGSTAWLLLVAILVIYLVLGILYESFIHPITILSGLAPAGLGALLTLLLFNQELNLYGFLGLIMLIGIVKKNAIMMVDFALEASRNRQATAAEAIYEACLVRFRPITMTTLAALMGTLPIALGIGGGESRQTLGLVVFGGLLVSQLLTLYITPVLYIYLDRFNRSQTPERGGAVQGIMAA